MPSNTPSPGLERPGFPVRLAVVFGMLAAGIAISGWLYYLRQKSTIERDSNHALAAIAELKVSQIVAWRSELLADGDFVRYNSIVCQALERVLSVGGQDAEREARNWMSAAKQRRGYNRLLLISETGSVRLAVPRDSGWLAPEDRRLAIEALAARSPRLSDLHRSADGTIHLDLSVPILSRAAGILLIEVDPRQSLYPLLQTWPVLSPSAEAFLVRREGSQVLYLTDLRHRKDSALSLRQPAAQSVLAGFVPGRDPRGARAAIAYNGARVVAAVRPIPGSSWILISEVDAEEVYGPIRQSALSTGLLDGLLFAATAVIGFLTWRNQQGSFLQRQYVAELERRELLVRLNHLSGEVNDIILLADEDGRILDANRRAATSYGHSLDELSRMRMIDLFPDAQRVIFQAQWQRAGETGSTVFEADQQRRDQSIFPIDIRLSKISQDGKTIFQSVIRDISETRAAESKLKKADRKTIELLEGISDGFAAFDRDWRYTYINAAGARMAGKTPSELLGGSLWDLWPDLENSVFGAAYRRAVAENAQIQVENFFAPLNAWFEVRCYPSSEGLSLLFVNTTERKRADETALLLSSIVESSDDAIISKDLDGLITSWNKGAERIYGYSSAEILGRPISLLVPPEHADEWPEILEYTRLGQRIEHLETERVRKDGQRIFVSVTVSPIRNSARQVTGASTIARDITEHKRAEKEIQAMNHELERRVVERTAEWENSNRELDAFAYSISHDLRAPLRAIDGFSRILLEEFAPQLPPQAQHYLQVARSNAVQMGNLIDALLTFSRLSRKPLSKQVVDLAALTRQALRGLRAEREGRLVEITVGELPACYGDPQLLLQVMVNLLSNAHKYTRTRECARIDIGATTLAGWKRENPDALAPAVAEDNSTVYFVRDNGVGFDMQYRDKLFGVFQRLHSAGEFEGTGAGLATVQRIILRHGGQIWAEAEVDRGATFYFTAGAGQDRGFAQQEAALKSSDQLA